MRTGLKKTIKRLKTYTAVDYTKKLNKEELKYLNQFSREFYQGYFKKGEKPLHSLEQRKQIYNESNQRRRDLYNRRDSFLSYNEITEQITCFEDYMIHKIEG